MLDDNLQERMLARMGADLDDDDRVRFRMSGMLVEHPEWGAVLTRPPRP